MKNKFGVISALVLLSIFLQACYIGQDVKANQVAVKLERNEIVGVVNAGVYTSWGFYDEMMVMDADTLTFSVEDLEVLTRDNQAVGVKITIQARRKTDDESVKNIFEKWSSTIDNNKLIEVISATAREGLKNGVRNYNLSELLNDRNGLGDSMTEQISQDVSKYSVEIINVTVENIAPSPDYMAILADKANITAETEKELERQKLIEQQASNDILQAQKTTEVKLEQVEAEKAITAVEVEIAKREGQVTAASQQVYTDNPQAFMLEQLRLLDAIFDGQTVYYLPEGVDLTTVFGLDKMLAR